jgi:hypothetical protein
MAIGRQIAGGQLISHQEQDVKLAFRHIGRPPSATDR